MSNTFNTYVCIVCGFIYDEAAGAPDEGIAPGTKVVQVDLDGAEPGRIGDVEEALVSDVAEFLRALQHSERGRENIHQLLALVLNGVGKHRPDIRRDLEKALVKDERRHVPQRFYAGK